MSAFGHIQTFLEEHANRRLQPLRYLHDCSDCFRLERLPGGIFTHWKAPPLHGAHPQWTLSRLCAHELLSRAPSNGYAPTKPRFTKARATQSISRAPVRAAACWARSEDH